MEVGKEWPSEEVAVTWPFVVGVMVMVSMGALPRGACELAAVRPCTH
jgi:hypothetical protein